MGILDGRVAIVTGGARGIGGSISRLFAAEGASVVVNDLGGTTDGTGGDAGPAHEMAEEIKAAGGQAVANAGDISEVATGEELVSTAIKEFGKLDIVVNVAGILRDRMIFNLTPEDWDAVIKVHLRGHYTTVRPASAYWREQRNPAGNYRVINFSSESGLLGSPGQPNYAAAKMGIVGQPSRGELQARRGRLAPDPVRGPDRPGCLEVGRIRRRRAPDVGAAAAGFALRSSHSLGS
jgi:NAD(P)-dependent dehydrogenase (short-subunit alcohol dehydrogenase family)